MGVEIKNNNKNNIIMKSIVQWPWMQNPATSKMSGERDWREQETVITAFDKMPHVVIASLATAMASPVPLQSNRNQKPML